MAQNEEFHTLLLEYSSFPVQFSRFAILQNKRMKPKYKFHTISSPLPSKVYYLEKLANGYTPNEADICPYNSKRKIKYHADRV